MIHVVHAVLLADGKYVLQLRDQNAWIARNQWSLFGGGIEPGESPPQAILRELREELSIPIQETRVLGCVDGWLDEVDRGIHISLFEADITAFWGGHRLTEGKAVDRFSFQDLLSIPIPNLIRGILEDYNAGPQWVVCENCGKSL